MYDSGEALHIDQSRECGSNVQVPQQQQPTDPRHGRISSKQSIKQTVQKVHEALNMQVVMTIAAAADDGPQAKLTSISQTAQRLPP